MQMSLADCSPRRFWVAMIFLHRIIALGGDTVEVSDNTVFVNGKELEQAQVTENPGGAYTFPPAEEGKVFLETNGDRSYLVFIQWADPRTGLVPVYAFNKTEVPEGHCFLMGDNRLRAMDSCYFGPVSTSDIIGRAEFFYYPTLYQVR